MYTDLPAYLNDHVRHTPDESKSIGTITIDVKSDADTGEHQYRRYDPTAKIDILPALQLVKTAPKVHIRCGTIACKWCGGTSHRSDFTEALDALIELERRPALAKYLDEAVVSVKLQFPPRLTFEIRGEYWKEWMGGWKLGHNVDFGDKEMKSWCDGLGLSLVSLAGASCFERCASN